MQTNPLNIASAAPKSPADGIAKTAAKITALGPSLLPIIIAVAPVLLSLVAGIAIAQALFTSPAPYVGDRGAPSFGTSLADSATRKEIIEAIVKKWHGEGRDQNETTIALQVAFAESGFNPKEISTTHDYGVFQINRTHFKDPGPQQLGIPGSNEPEMIQNLLNPGINIDVAYKLRVRDGWGPWVAYHTGAYIRRSKELRGILIGYYGDNYAATLGINNF